MCQLVLASQVLDDASEQPCGGDFTDRRRRSRRRSESAAVCPAISLVGSHGATIALCTSWTM